MLFTMRQAERQLMRYSRLGPTAARDAILDAVEALAATRYWDRMRQTIRFTTTGGGRFALPQEFDAIVRAAVDGTPAPVRGTEFNFLYGGPGDLDELPTGFKSYTGLIDEGFHTPLTLTPDTDYRLAASMTTADPSLTVKVFFVSGDTLSLPILAHDDVEDAADWDAISAATALGTYGEVQKVVLRSDNWPSGWVNLWAGEADDTPELCRISRFHSSSKVPQLRHYLIPGADPDLSYAVLAEVRPALLRATGDDDVVPIPSLMPVQYMMQAHCKFDEGEMDTGQKYYELAVGSLMQIDEASSNKQTVVIFNRSQDDSPGDDSSGYANI
jgi:hypothetical protein